MGPFRSAVVLSVRANCGPIGPSQLWSDQNKSAVVRSDHFFLVLLVNDSEYNNSTGQKRQLLSDRATSAVLIRPTSAIQGRTLKVCKSAKREPILDLRPGRLWEERSGSAGGLWRDQIVQSSPR